MKKGKILIVDDELHILELLKYNLEKEGYEVLEAENGDDCISIAQREILDLILLDWMLPGMDGLKVLQILKSQVSTLKIPVIMLTAKGEEIDKVLGLEMGADDYIVKPFGVRELLARVKAVLRRNVNTSNNSEDSIQSEVVVVGELKIDLSTREVYKEGRLIEMPLKEFELLVLLSKNIGKVLTREYLLEKVWGYDYYGETRTVDVHIRYLRQKIEQEGKEYQYIETVRGVGYKMKIQEGMSTA